MYFCADYKLSKSTSEKTLIGLPSGEVSTNILSSIVQTLSNVPSLLRLLASSNNRRLQVVRFSLIKMPRCVVLGYPGNRSLGLTFFNRVTVSLLVKA